MRRARVTKHEFVQRHMETLRLSVGADVETCDACEAAAWSDLLQLLVTPYGEACAPK